MAEFPEIHHRVVEERDLEPGTIKIGDRLSPMWDVTYAKLIEEFESMGATRVRKAS